MPKGWPLNRDVWKSVSMSSGHVCVTMMCGQNKMLVWSVSSWDTLNLGH